MIDFESLPDNFIVHLETAEEWIEFFTELKDSFQYVPRIERAFNEREGYMNDPDYRYVRIYGDVHRKSWSRGTKSTYFWPDGTIKSDWGANEAFEFSDIWCPDCSCDQDTIDSMMDLLM